MFKQETAEEKALAWIIYNDPLQLSPDNETSKFRLQQRYALLTLFLQFPELTAKGFNDTECEWPIVRRYAKSTEPATLGVDVATHVFINNHQSAPGSTLSRDLGLLSNLVSFHVVGARLMGSLPSSLGAAWTNLYAFSVFTNDLTGSLPSSLGMTWTNLSYFTVAKNAVTGSLPPSLGTQWTNLKYFTVSDIRMKGRLPTSLGSTWSNLKSFDIRNSTLTGTLPSSLGTTWTNLEYFDVKFNALTGTLPSSLGTAWANLEDFDVRNNALKGAIPNDLAINWNKLKRAFFHNNSLVGSIPSRVCTIAGLYVLGADCDDNVTCSCCTLCCLKYKCRCVRGEWHGYCINK
jgi:hypothetical protein